MHITSACRKPLAVIVTSDTKSSKKTTEMNEIETNIQQFPNNVQEICVP